jgi:peptidoglycan/LPS O-acetylase OafA/YrhL
VSTRDRQYLPALDGIRAFAVLAVLLYHAEALSPGPPRFGGGFLGVSVFFTLSGFLIGSQLLREHEREGKIAMRGFARRRIARLAPAALATIALVVLASGTTLAPWKGAGFLAADALSAIWNVTNWHLILLSDAVGFRLVHPLTHFWSLAVEAQLYVLLALTCALGARHALRPFLWTMVRLAWVGSLLMALVVHGSVRREEFGTDIRLAEFAAGVGLAVLLPRVAPWFSTRRRLADGIGLGAIVVFVLVVTCVSRNEFWLGNGGYAVLSLVWVAWLVGALAGSQVPLLLQWRPLVALGTISYSLYLVHWPVVLVLNDARLGLGHWAAVTVRVIASLLVAVALYVAVERPGRRIVAARRAREVVPGWVIACLAVSALSLVILPR